MVSTTILYGFRKLKHRPLLFSLDRIALILNLGMLQVHEKNGALHGSSSTQRSICILRLFHPTHVHVAPCRPKLTLATFRLFFELSETMQVILSTREKSLCRRRTNDLGSRWRAIPCEFLVLSSFHPPSTDKLSI